MKKESHEIIHDLYKKHGGTDEWVSISDSCLFILNKVYGKYLYSKITYGHYDITILKNMIKSWTSNPKEHLEFNDQLLKYIEKEILLFKFELINKE